VSFAAGETMKPLSLTVNGDYAIEPDEQAFIDLSAPVNAILADSRGVITITNDDSAGTLALASGAISLSEGATATTIQIQRSGGQGQDVGATFATVAGTAIAGADYTALSRRLRFAGGQSAQTVDIALLPDALDEDDESFSAGLAGAFGGAAIGNPGTIVMTIQDNDPTPSLSIDNGGCTLIEGNSGTQNCAFVLRLSALSGRAVGLTTTTTGVSASGVVDFTAHTQVVRTLNAGLPTLSVLVPVIGDTAVEPTESFTLDVSATVNATPTSLLGVGTIVNDDGDGLLSNGFE
jgi:hypothetical protein